MMVFAKPIGSLILLLTGILHLSVALASGASGNPICEISPESLCARVKAAETRGLDRLSRALGKQFKEPRDVERYIRIEIANEAPFQKVLSRRVDETYLIDFTYQLARSSELQALYSRRLGEKVFDLYFQIFPQQKLKNARLLLVSQFERSRKDLLNAISTTPMPLTAKLKVMRQVRLIRLDSPLDPKPKDEFEAFAGTCGPFGLEDNAYTYPAPNHSHSYVAICGAKLLPLLYTEPNHDAPLDFLSRVFVHEMGHRIQLTAYDPETFTYRKLESCIKEHHWDRFKRGMMTEGDAVINHMGEIISDYWGNEVLASRIASEMAEQGPGSFNRALNLITRNSGSFCDLKSLLPEEADEGVHPSGHWRLDYLLKHPRTQKAFGCAKSSSTPYCGLNGAE